MREVSDLPRHHNDAHSGVLLTGASGFLGKYIAAELVSSGYQVIGHGRDAQRLGENLAQAAALAKPGTPAPVAWQGELSDLPAAPFGADAVIHSAALSSAWGPWEDFKSANVDGTAAVLDWARRRGVRRFVFISSPSVYARASHQFGVTESDIAPGKALNAYIQSKLEAEDLVRAAQAKGDIQETVILRPRGLTGAGDPALLPRLLRANERIGIPIIGDGMHQVELTAVSNAAYAARLALESHTAIGGTFHISNGEPRPFVELVEYLFDRLGITPRFRRVPAHLARGAAYALEGVARALPAIGEPPLTRYTLTTIAYSLTLDLSAARQGLGYEPRTPLDHALNDLADATRAGRGGT